MKSACAWGGFVLGLLFLGASPAVGQTRVCADRQTMLDRFEAQYHEAPVARALTNTGGVLEVLSTGDGATWSLMLTQPNGTSCIVAFGRYWQVMARARPGRET